MNIGDVQGRDALILSKSALFLQQSALFRIMYIE